MRDMKVVRLPYLSIIMDEHTGDAGLKTRIGAFVEMIKRKKKAKAREKKEDVQEVKIY
jgi:predicted nucleotide-binding protein (sugar kinase/HSP70/actin superfamily)